jgi:hypothetical protein
MGEGGKRQWRKRASAAHRVNGYTLFPHGNEAKAIDKMLFNFG